jgi:hypothetical protein
MKLLSKRHSTATPIPIPTFVTFCSENKMNVAWVSCPCPALRRGKMPLPRPPFMRVGPAARDGGLLRK